MRTSWRSVRGLVGITLLIFILSYIPITRDAFVGMSAPFIGATRRSGESLGASMRLIGRIPDLARENGVLQAKVNELQAESITYKELKHENDLLRKELNLSAPFGTTKIAAQVISRSSSVSLQSIIVNKGSEEGFVKGMPIIAQGYLVGQVDEVFPHTSTVTLLTSINSLLPVVLQNSRSIGLLKGGAEGLIIDEIPRDVIITPHEAVVTSHLGDAIRSGIPVGTISAVLSGKSDVFQSARVISPIDLSRLEVVFGLK